MTASMLWPGSSAPRRQLGYGPVGLNLSPETFTLPELQRLHESILGRPLDRRTFQKKMLELGTLDRVGELRGGGCDVRPTCTASIRPATRRRCARGSCSAADRDGHRLRCADVEVARGADWENSQR